MQESDAQRAADLTAADRAQSTSRSNATETEEASNEIQRPSSKDSGYNASPQLIEEGNLFHITVVKSILQILTFCFTI